jgi:hypothetical protein
MRRRRGVRCSAVALVSVAGVACSIPAFDCSDDSQCVAAAEGRCEPDGRCSYPDDACPSRRRYGEFAGDLSRTCVDGAVTSSSDATTQTLDPSTSGLDTGSPSSTSGSSTSTGTPTSTESGTTGTLPPMPLGHWPLDEGTGMIANDIGSGQHHGVVEGGDWLDVGKLGGAVAFAVEDDGIEIGAYPEFDLQQADGLTLMGWCRLDALPIPNVSIIAKFGAYGLQFWGDDVDLNAVFVLYPAGATADGDTDGPINANVPLVSCAAPAMTLTGAEDPLQDGTIWHHYAGTYDVTSRTIAMYLDGVEVCSVDASIDMADGTLEVTTTGVQLGRWQSTGPTMFGAIDDVRIYDVVVSADDIAVIASETR